MISFKLINITFSILFVLITISFFILLIKYFNLKNKTKILNYEKLTYELEKNKFYTSIDLEKINKEIDEYIKTCLANYLFESGIILEDQIYISDNEMKDIIKSVSYDVITNMSDLYKSYFSLIYNIKYDNDEFDFNSIVFIRNKVKDQVINLVRAVNNK